MLYGSIFIFIFQKNRPFELDIINNLVGSKSLFIHIFAALMYVRWGYWKISFQPFFKEDTNELKLLKKLLSLLGSF